VLAQRGQGELGRPAVRGDDGIVRILQDLEGLDTGGGRVVARAPPAAVVGNEPLPRQGGLRRDVDTGRQVTEVVVIRNLVEVEPAEQRTTLVVGGDEAHRRAAFVRGA